MSDYISNITMNVLSNQEGKSVKQIIISNQAKNRRIKAHDFIFNYEEDAEYIIKYAIVDMLVDAILAMEDME